MPRQPHPWYRQQAGWWMAQLDRKKVKLVEGRNDKKTEDLARRKLAELFLLRSVNPIPESPLHTVASIIDLYLNHSRPRLGERTFQERHHYLQAFAETHGWRKVNDKECLPYHLTSAL